MPVPCSDIGQKTKGVEDQQQQQVMDLQSVKVAEDNGSASHKVSKPLLPQSAPTYESSGCHTYTIVWRQQTQESLPTLCYYAQDKRYPQNGQSTVYELCLHLWFHAAHKVPFPQWLDFQMFDLMIMALCCSFTLDLSITAERTFVPVAGFCGTDIKIILIASLESAPTYLKAVCRSSSSLITMVALMPQLVKCTLFSVVHCSVYWDE